LLVFSLAFCFITVGVPPCVYTPFFVPYATLRTAPDRLNQWHAYLNEHVDGTLLLVGEAQVFDFEVPILYNAWLDDSVFESIVRDPSSGSLRPADEICAELRSRHISHVYVSWSEIARYRATGYGNWEWVEPEVFDQLIRAGVLEWIPSSKELEGSVNQVYRVSCERTAWGITFRDLLTHSLLTVPRAGNEWDRSWSTRTRLCQYRRSSEGVGDEEEGRGIFWARECSGQAGRGGVVAVVEPAGWYDGMRRLRKPTSIPPGLTGVSQLGASGRDPHGKRCQNRRFRYFRKQ
jgi:hypothetical protein